MIRRRIALLGLALACSLAPAAASAQGARVPAAGAAASVDDPFASARQMLRTGRHQASPTA